MFNKLKQCKTLREIYEVLGEKPFEVAAVVILALWTLLPIMATIGQIEISMNEEYSLGRGFLVVSDYQHNVESLGLITLEFAVLYLMGRIILNKGQILKKIKAEPWHFLLLLMLFWACISTALSDEPKTAFFGTEYRFDGLETYFFYAAVHVCASALMKNRYKKYVLMLFGMVANIVAILLIWQDSGSTFWNQIFLSERAAMFFQFNHAGYYLCMSIATLIGMYLYEKKRVVRIVYIISMIVQVYGLLVNSTLGGFLGISCALIMILTFYVRKQGKCAWRMLTPVLVIVLLAGASYMGMIPTSSGEDMKINIETMLIDSKNIAENSDYAIYAGHGRFELWQRSLKMIPERPIFGYGPEVVNMEYMEGVWTERASNEFIQYAVFLGVPGLLYYLTAMIWLFIHQWKKMRQLDSATLMAAGCVIAYLVSSFFGNTMFYTTPYFYMFLALAAGRVKE